MIAEEASPSFFRSIFTLAGERGVPVQKISRSYLDKLAPGIVHQGVLAMVAARGYVEVDDLLAGIMPGVEPFLILLDGILDPQNLGAILRIADAAGAHGLIIPRRRAVPLTHTVGKVSAGAVEYVRVARVTNLVQTIARLKEKGLWIAGADPAGPHLFWDVSLSGPLGLVIGGEGKGLGRLVKECCDVLVSLPMAGRVESLNASVAAALLAYEVVRQRRLLNSGVPHNRRL
jgi:23S rRNA (guanosine2251-2'-O)-methyltransferase